MGPYSAYEYLTFILPGATVLFVSVYGWFGWPWKEPGASVLVGLVAACFLVGNAVSALATWLQPALLGDRPGSVANSLWGQFGEGEPSAGQQQRIEEMLRARYGDVSLQEGYGLARTEVAASPQGSALDRLNQQIGFYRGMTISCVIALAIEVVLAIGWHTHLPPGLWLPIFAGTSLMFGYRFRRFWRWYADYVLRTTRLLPPNVPVQQSTTNDQASTPRHQADA